jgi:hypothetical protein
LLKLSEQEFWASNPRTLLVLIQKYCDFNNPKEEKKQRPKEKISLSEARALL